MDEQNGSISSMDTSEVPSSRHQLRPKHAPVASLSPERSPSQVAISSCPTVKRNPLPFTVYHITFVLHYCSFSIFFNSVSVPLPSLPWIVPYVLKSNCLPFQLKKKKHLCFDIFYWNTLHILKCKFFVSFCFGSGDVCYQHQSFRFHFWNNSNSSKKKK